MRRKSRRPHGGSLFQMPAGARAKVQFCLGRWFPFVPSARFWKLRVAGGNLARRNRHYLQSAAEKLGSRGGAENADVWAACRSSNSEAFSSGGNVGRKPSSSKYRRDSRSRRSR